MFAAPALADMTVGTPGAATPVAGTSRLGGVACSSATSCLAVGSKRPSSGPSDAGVGVVVPITNGTPGAATTVAGTDSLNGVACSSATSCVAVGHKSPNAFASDVGVVVPITNGTPGAATPVAGTGFLRGVACSSATSCVAVGDKGPSDASVGVVVPVTNGTPGAATTVTGTDRLNGVACASATSCMAVGNKASSDVGVVVAITSDIPSVPTVAAGTDSLNGVTCASATSCMAVGSGPTAFGASMGVVVAITNGTPRATTTPVPGAVSLGGVACASATSCLAVGDNPSIADPAFAGGVVVTITNGAPRATTLATGTDSLNGVACSSATSCLAVEDSDSSVVGVVVPITYAPGVSGYSLTNNPFVVAGGSTPESGSAAKTKKHKKGTTFRYTLSEAAAVKIVIAERRLGRRKHKKCVAPTRKLRDARKCTRLTTRGTLTRTSHQGANSVAFTGRIGSTALTPGSYQATLTATDGAQNTSRAQTILFRIVKRSLAASAPARIGDAVIQDCAQDSELNHHYSDRQLRDALRHIPSDVDQFTNCPDVIGKALAASAAARLGDAVIEDCVRDGVLDHRYSNRQLRDALRHIPHNVDRFTSCRAVIETALQDQRGAHRVNPCRRSLRQELSCLRTPAARRRLVRSVREARAYLRVTAAARVELRHRRPRVMASVGAVERKLASCDAYSTAPSEPAERVGIALVSRAALMPVADILAALGRRLRRIHAHDPVLRSGARAWGDYADGAANLPGLPADAICGALTAWGARGYDPASAPVNIPAIASSIRRLSRDDRTIARAGVRMRRLYIDEQRTQLFSPAGLFEGLVTFLFEGVRLVKGVCRRGVPCGRSR